MKQENETFAKGLAAVAEMGQLGHLEPRLAYTMIDSVAGDPDVMSVHFPGRTRADLADAYESEVMRLVFDDSKRVERESRVSCMSGDWERLSQRTGIAADRIARLLGGDIRTIEDLDDLARLNNM